VVGGSGWRRGLRGVGLVAASSNELAGVFMVLFMALPKGQGQGPGLPFPGLPVLRLLGLLSGRQVGVCYVGAGNC
jgi:hypothetical protein